HAGSRNVIHRNVMLFEPFQNADVGQAQCASALERYADLGARTLLPGGRNRSCRLRLLLPVKVGKNGKELKTQVERSKAERPNQRCLLRGLVTAPVQTFYWECRNGQIRREISRGYTIWSDGRKGSRELDAVFNRFLFFGDGQQCGIKLYER